MQDGDFDALAERILKRATSILENKEWTPDDQPWNEHAEGTAEPANYEPTGHTQFDALVNRLKPPFRYGGSQPMNAVRGDVFRLRLVARMAGKKRVNPPEGAIFINMPHKQDFKDDDSYTSTIAHEVMHWWETLDPTAPIAMGLKSADPKDAGKEGIDPAYIVEEMTAELGSALLMQATGVEPNVENRAMYFAGYYNAVPKDFKEVAFGMAKERAIKAVKAMIAA